MAKRIVVKKSDNSKLKNYRSTFKSNSVVIGAVERHVVTKNLEATTRNPHVIHPSEICKLDTCRRAIYYRLTDTPADLSDVDTSFTLERIFAEGHDIHDKWQRWLWEMGKLYGYWECVVCDQYWYACSPKRCMNCSAPINKLRYREVPVTNEEHMLAGHADGLLDEGLIEVKSVGLGTLRFEAPGFYDKFQSGEWTLQETWNAIKRPFPAHVRQGMLYAFCKKIEKVIFIYEWKPTQAIKEFVVSYSAEILEPVLSACKDIKYAVKKRKPLPRPNWASPTNKTCKACPYKGVCYAEDSD